MRIKPFTIERKNEDMRACGTETVQSPTEEQLENRPPFLKQMKQCVEEKSPENRSACVTQAMQYQQEQNPGNMLPYGAQAMQNPAVRYPEENYEVQKAETMEWVKTNGEIQRAREKARIRLCEAECRSLQKEEDQERKKAQYNELQVTDTGQIQLITRNLRIEANPRSVTDLTNPSITILTRAKNIDEKIFLFTGYVGKDKKEIYLDAKKIGSGSYLIKKFVSKGVTFKLSITMQKMFAIQLICVLLNNYSVEKLLPEMPGWMRWPDGRYTFVEQEDLTWEYIQQRIK